MKSFSFCTQDPVRHICRLTGKGRLCLGHRVLQRGVLLCLALSVCVVSPAQTACQPPACQQTGDGLAVEDSVDTRRGTFNPNQLIVPSALVAVGAFGVSNGWFRAVKRDVRHGLHDIRGESRMRADDYLQYFPVASCLGLGFLGVKPRHPLRERVAETATAYAVMGLAVNVTKSAVNAKRPDSSADNSFPSGHTATTFMGAELVRLEYGNAYGTAAYVFASGIAVLRLYNDRHWLNDVIAGAGIGILSARIAGWLLPWERRVLGWKKSASSVSVVPAYNPRDRSLAITVNAGL